MSQFIPRFQLKEPMSTEKTVIRLRLGYDYKDFTWELNDSLNRKLKIYPELWDSKNQYPLPKTKIPKKFRNETYNLQVIGETINKVKVAINDIINESALNEIKINNSYLKQELLSKLGLISRQRNVLVCEFCADIIGEMETGLLKTEKETVYSEGTIKQFKVLNSFLKAFRPQARFNDIDEAWYRDFVRFCQNHKMVKKDKQMVLIKEGSENSTVGSKIKKLKSLMEFASSKGKSTNRNHIETWFKILKNDYEVSKTDLYLSEKEIKKIYNFIPQENVIVRGQVVFCKTLEKAKDLFLIGCYTGLRVSDYNSSLSKENFKTTDKGTPIVQKMSKKTRTPVSIPIYWNELIEIAEKYNYEFPKMSDQKINDYIKVICKSIDGFDEKKIYFDGKAGNVKQQTMEKWELITTHTGRRSASTNLALNGLSEGEVAKFTGHKTDSMVAKYNKASTHQTADMLYAKLKNNNNEK